MIDLMRRLGHLDPRARMERRRRIYAIADWWSLHLILKYPDRGEALARCRRRQVETMRSRSTLRNQIWSLVSRSLKRYDR